MASWRGLAQSTGERGEVVTVRGGHFGGVVSLTVGVLLLVLEGLAALYLRRIQRVSPMRTFRTTSGGSVTPADLLRRLPRSTAIPALAVALGVVLLVTQR